MLRKSSSNREISFDRKCVPGHDVFGSKGFTEQLSRVKRSGPGTMIRRPIAKSNRSRGAKGNRARYSGESFRQLAELNAAILGDLNILEGSGDSAAAGNVGRKLGNGFIALIPPGPGPTGLSGGAKEPNEPERISAGIEECGQEQRPHSGNLETGRRGGRAKGCFEVLVPNRRL